MTRLLIRFLRDVRLVPIVLVAIVSLFALKTLGLLLDGGYLFDNVAGQTTDGADVTGAVTDRRGADVPASAPSAAPTKSMGAADVQLSGCDRRGRCSAQRASRGRRQTRGGRGKAAGDQAYSERHANPARHDHPLSPAERAVLESLQKRRTELDARAHDLDIREDLVKGAEKRLEGRIAELKELESRVDDAVQRKDEAQAAGFKNVVTMYENMKAKDAAKIFDGLDMKVLFDVAKAINPRTMSEILAQMQPDAAQRLTTALAARPGPKDQPQTADLPKIEGRPTAN